MPPDKLVHVSLEPVVGMSGNSHMNSMSENVDSDTGEEQA
jgi:hypothetical protein